MPRSTQDRLKAVCERGNLRVADLARWFIRPYQTVRFWVEKGNEPSGGPRDVAHIMSLLGLLETMIKTRNGLPVPEMKATERQAYLARLRKVMFP